MAVRVWNSAVRTVFAYVECVRRDVMPSFSDLEQRADQIVEAEYNRLGSGPVRDDCDVDMASLAEAAHDKGLAFYETMFGIRQAVQNLFVVGLFHLLEQELADLCCDGAITAPPPAESRLAVLVAWYSRHFRLELETLPAWPTVDELRLVANATKHAEGSAVQQLRIRRPELFHNPVLGETHFLPGPVKWAVRRPLSGEHFYVTPEIFQQYAEASSSFISNIARHFEGRGDEFYA
jgi:hypothetical protein